MMLKLITEILRFVDAVKTRTDVVYAKIEAQGQQL